MIYRLLSRHKFLAAVNVMVVVAIAITVLSDVWFNPNYRTLANVALLTMTVLVVFFTLLYVLRSRWNSNKIGLIYAVKCGALSLVLVQATVASWWDLEYPFRQQIRFAIYAIGALVYLPMIISLFREQNRDRADGGDGLMLRPDAPPL
ncbi:hypothetical protein [Mycolicibacterium sp. F2034L]|uniref:putative phage holin n=1 Tax=Mycolicibacterium sp. F2034L TaxID=2926422 RepID=UPI001FF1BA07|nr:hypothetical protein [Mycolicibacterium sp. F2034L]MCK0174819.1 hypothetical protein [Mycolicibacterium sp. F2034L]